MVKENPLSPVTSTNPEGREGNASNVIMAVTLEFVNSVPFWKSVKTLPVYVYTYPILST
jgi:hypothetical protein